MNHFYKQDKGICAACAYANAKEKLTGVVLTDDEVWALFKDSGGKDDTKARKGAISYEAILSLEKKRGNISDYKKVYFNPAIHMKKSPAKAKELADGKLEIFNALQSRKGTRAVVIGIHTPTGGLKTYSNGFVIRGDLAGYHAVLVDRMGKDKLKTAYFCENSYGPNWGLDGYFKMTEDDFDHMVREAYIISK